MPTPRPPAVPFDEQLARTIAKTLLPLYVTPDNRDREKELELGGHIMAAQIILQAKYEILTGLPLLKGNDYAVARRAYKTAEADLRRSLSEFQAYIDGVRVDTGRNRTVHEFVDENFLFQEIRSLWDKFGLVRHDAVQNTLSVFTEDILIVYENVHVMLGPYEIRWKYMELPGTNGSSDHFLISTLSPDRVSTRGGYIHPHVQVNRMCPGEIASGLRVAERSGFVFNAFNVIDRMLHNYHHEGNLWGGDIRMWGSRICSICDDTIPGDTARLCHVCDTAYCAGCAFLCDTCGRYYCKQCGDRDPENPRVYRCPCVADAVECGGCQFLYSKEQINPGTGYCPTCLTLWARSGPPNRRTLPTREAFLAQRKVVEERLATQGTQTGHDPRREIPFGPRANDPDPFLTQRTGRRGDPATTTPRTPERAGAAPLLRTGVEALTMEQLLAEQNRRTTDALDHLDHALDELVEQAAQTTRTRPLRGQTADVVFFDEATTFAPGRGARVGGGRGTELGNTPQVPDHPNDGNAVLDQFLAFADDLGERTTLEATTVRALGPVRDQGLPADVPDGTDVATVRPDRYRLNGVWYARPGPRTEP